MKNYKFFITTAILVLAHDVGATPISFEACVSKEMGRDPNASSRAVEQRCKQAVLLECYKDHPAIKSECGMQAEIDVCVHSSSGHAEGDTASLRERCRKTISKKPAGRASAQ